ncbi:hypothetical protein DDD_1099 [Nonlabens dokdonensis DSW-6]|uniref:Uncharacterized protein n=1 Tax=Nonlabens dokdonensis (strain DSM 17205 / KCTC 12402 / DSW-6) TaxID=592029 RepID=L7W3S6_NONDD|nr:hypothetical protein DDD_1099 [Nonlabens dokdonensis DSW-6]
MLGFLFNNIAKLNGYLSCTSVFAINLSKNKLITVYYLLILDNT